MANSDLHDILVCTQRLPDATPGDVIMCKKHNCQISFWCNSCKKRLCKSCLSEQHKTCDWQLIEDKLVSEQNYFDKFAENKHDNIKTFQSKVQKLKTKNVDLRSQVTAMMNCITAFDKQMEQQFESLRNLERTVVRTQQSVRDLKEIKFDQTDKESLLNLMERNERLRQTVSQFQLPDLPAFKNMETSFNNLQVRFLHFN